MGNDVKSTTNAKGYVRVRGSLRISFLRAANIIASELL